MAEQGDRTQGTEPDPTPASAADDHKLLDDLDPEEEAAGVEGGQRATWARWGLKRV